MCARATTLWLFLSAFVGCTDSHPEKVRDVAMPLTNAALDDDDPAVVGVAIQERIYCSATVIAAHVALTAAHCVRDIHPDALVFGARADSNAKYVALSPQHTILAGFDLGTHTNDLALLYFEEAASVAPLRWATSRAAVDADAAVRLVGYGRPNPTDVAPLQKRRGTAVVNAADGKLQIRPLPTAPCNGDSGGPVLLKDGAQEVIVGVITDGSDDCTSANAIDLRPHDSFLSSGVEAAREHGTDVGQRCYLDVQCNVGSLCFSPADAPQIRYCSARCENDSQCLSTMHCVEGNCSFPRPSPGAHGTRCDVAEECDEQLCAAARGGTTAVCTHLCVADDLAACANGETCQPLAHSSGLTACFPGSELSTDISPRGGCTVAPCRPESPVVATALVLSPIGMLRRRQRRKRVGPKPTQSQR